MKKKFQSRTFLKYLFLTITFFLLAKSTQIFAQRIYINEFLASNVTSDPEIYDYDDYPDWIELYNAENYPVNLDGYYITDNFNSPNKWEFPPNTNIPANGFLLLWADGYDDDPGTYGIRGYHLNFKLSQGREEIALFNSDGELIDSVTYGLQISDVSFGRKPDGGSGWFYFGEPTARSSNLTTGILNTGKSVNAELFPAGGFFNGPQIVTLSSAKSDAVIYYTLDGSRPGTSSNLYTEPINLNKTTVIRARVFENGKLPGSIITQTYLIDESHTLPVLSITAFPETLFGTGIGIYNNEIKGAEVPVNMEFFSNTKNSVLNITGGIRLSGQASFAYPQKPLTISTKDRYGYEFIEYPFWEDVDNDIYKSIYLRNSGTPDNRHTMFRDALQHSLVINQMDLDCQAYRPVVTYINGKYWGIYNLREKLDEDYLAYHHNVDPTNIDYLEYDFDAEPVVISGDTEAFNDLWQYLQRNNLSAQANYEYIKNQIDVDEVINYLITEIYCDNVNWPTTNCRWWKERTDGSKWRYVMLDLDFGFGCTAWTSDYRNNTFYHLFPAGLNFGNFIFGKLFESQEFRNEFIQRFAGYLNTTFKTERVVSIVDSIKALIYSEMEHHIDRWNNGVLPIMGDGPIPDMDVWNSNVEIMRNFGLYRTVFQRQHIIDFFGLSGTSYISFNVNKSEFGKIYASNIEVPPNTECTYFNDVPITIEAVPEIGYKFVRWEGESTSTSRTISISVNGDTYLNAVFEPDDVSLIPSLIDANITLSSVNSPFYSFGDIKVNPNITLTIEPGVVINMPENSSIYVNGNIEFNGTEENPIVLKPNNIYGANSWGAVCIKDGTGISKFQHVKIEGATKGLDGENFIGAISAVNSNTVIENVTILDAPFPIFIIYGQTEIRNCLLHSEKTCDLVNVKYADYAIIENCDMRGNVSYDTDAIDYDGLDGGIIRGNKIYNFYGFNSDGIDLGEESKNILVENNLIFNIADKGISVGQASTTQIKNNVFVNCAQGVGVKDFFSYAFIDRNTFYGNDYHVASFEKNFGAGGGTVDVVNSIFTESKIYPFMLDDLSELNISYTLCESYNIDGIGNIHSNAFFANNFRLKSNSPAINSGDPASGKDPDGTQIDLGAFYYNPIDQFPLLINEINYFPSNGDNYEFIELYNSGNSVLNISGYKFEGGIEYTFPSGTIVNSDEYILIAKSSLAYAGNGYQVFGWGNSFLPNNRADLILKNTNDEIIDWVSYDSRQGWSGDAHGRGHTLELRNQFSENLYTYNWQGSFEVYGSPGKSNQVNLADLLFINEIQAINNSTIRDEYGEFNDWIEIYNNSTKDINIASLYITDNPDNLTKYKIPVSDEITTTIHAKGYLIIWADEESDQGILHTNFKLDGNGEECLLVQIIDNDTTIIDRVVFNDMEDDISFGRINDGEEEFEIFSFPTPGRPNSIDGIFESGILLVNGVYSIDNTSLKDAYKNKAFWGNYNISFWNCFNDPQNGYPSTIPAPLGNGNIPVDVLHRFSTVIWICDNRSGDLEIWNNADIRDYLWKGGNVIIMSQMGHAFFEGSLNEIYDLNWLEESSAAIQNCEAAYDGLIDIELYGTQPFNSVFSTNFSNGESVLLFKQRISAFLDWGIGFWNKPEMGGAYKSDGGQFVYISGKPYRYDHSDLRHNFEYILKNFFGETGISDVNENELITTYRLEQNYPNPFNPTTTLQYQIPEEGLVTLKVYDILGQEVTILVNEYKKTGMYKVEFNAARYSSGVYFYKLTAGSFSDVKKLMLLK